MRITKNKLLLNFTIANSFLCLGLNSYAQSPPVTPVVPLLECVSADALARKIYRRIESNREKDARATYAYSRIFWDVEEQTKNCKVVSDAAKQLSLQNLGKDAVSPAFAERLSSGGSTSSGAFPITAGCPPATYRDCPQILVIPGGGGSSSGAEILRGIEAPRKGIDTLKLPDRPAMK